MGPSISYKPSGDHTSALTDTSPSHAISRSTHSPGVDLETRDDTILPTPISPIEAIEPTLKAGITSRVDTVLRAYDSSVVARSMRRATGQIVRTLKTMVRRRRVTKATARDRTLSHTVTNGGLSISNSYQGTQTVVKRGSLSSVAQQDRRDTDLGNV